MVAAYREFAPPLTLREHVRAFFTFGPADRPIADTGPRRLVREIMFESGDDFRAPTFADASASIVVTLGMRSAMAKGVWIASAEPEGHVIGPMNSVGAPAPAEHSAMIGVYLRAAPAVTITGAPLSELTDRVTPLEDLWVRMADLPSELAELGDAERLDRLGAELSRRLRTRAHLRRQTSIDVSGLAAWARRSRGQLTVADMAHAAGVSRQHLTRVFRQEIGLSPKPYCRLARFQAALGYANAGRRVEWSQVAAALNYADQSHMIAEFRRFSSLTPREIASERVFHPFIEQARITATERAGVKDSYGLPNRRGQEQSHD